MASEKTRRRARRAMEQQLLVRPRGGRRRGAGRKPQGARAGVSHAARAVLSGREPVLVTLKMRREVWSLRSRRAFTRIVRSLSCARDRFGTRIVHFSVQRDHAHLLVEPESRAALSRAMQGLCVRIARALNRVMGRKGAVFADRYHARVLQTPRQVRHAVRYVLSNALRHGVMPPGAVLDPFSSAAAFDGWSRDVVREAARSLVARIVSPPRTWLLSRGWRRGGPLDPTHRPGPPG